MNIIDTLKDDSFLNEAMLLWARYQVHLKNHFINKIQPNSWTKVFHFQFLDEQGCETHFCFLGSNVYN